MKKIKKHQPPFLHVDPPGPSLSPAIFSSMSSFFFSFSLIQRLAEYSNVCVSHFLPTRFCLHFKVSQCELATCLKTSATFPAVRWSSLAVIYGRHMCLCSSHSRWLSFAVKTQDSGFTRAGEAPALQSLHST